MDNFFKNKKVFVTGHTGFKGAWFIQILYYLGADVKGFSLKPKTKKDLFNQIEGNQFCSASVYGDILDYNLLKKEILDFQPDFVFHLAAQALVRTSYQFPVDTFNVNIIGTANVLNAMRFLEKPCVGIMITTDKVYENIENGNAFQEHDKLGGHDPYSASKAAAEIIISSYRNSFFPIDKFEQHQTSIASVRAGNVIGGGDYATDRIIPDIVKCIEHKEVVELRNPFAIRPWQHVLEPLHAYLILAVKIKQNPSLLSTSFNIGPEKEDILTVEALTRKFISFYGNGSYKLMQHQNELHEAKTLILDNAKMKEALNWESILNVNQAIQWTAEWYADTENPAIEKCKKQIYDYDFSIREKTVE